MHAREQHVPGQGETHVVEQVATPHEEPALAATHAVGRGEIRAEGQVSIPHEASALGAIPRASQEHDEVQREVQRLRAILFSAFPSAWGAIRAASPPLAPMRGFPCAKEWPLIQVRVETHLVSLQFATHFETESFWTRFEKQLFAIPFLLALSHGSPGSLDSRRCEIQTEAKPFLPELFVPSLQADWFRVQEPARA